MSRQLSLGTGFERYAETTRRGKFLAEMDRIVPWAELCALVAPQYPGAGDGRRPKELPMMLRVYFLQQWFKLSDPGVEEALYDSAAMRRFAGIDLGEMAVPDESTVCRFRHLQAQGIKAGTGTIVDATIIAAAPFTKNKEKKRDPGMHQTRKGNQWHFRMKAHLGVDSKTTVIHAVAATPANVHDATCLPDLLHGEETRIWGDAAYQGQGKLIREHAPKAGDFTHRRYHKGCIDEAERARNRTKSRVRARIEHAFFVLERVFGFVKTRYRGLEKNAQRLFVSCALANLYMMRRRLLPLSGA